jgi:signal transduction histidine kinase
VHLLEESERRREELERSTASRERLVRGFSHDLKNPLGAALGATDLLDMGLKGTLSDEQRETVERIRRSIDTALDLIDDVLELARAEAGQLPIEREAVDLRALITEVIETFRASAEEEGLALSVEVPDVVPLIESDASRIRQILGNLLSNAVKYTPAGGRITVRQERREDGSPGPGSWFAIAVTDTGPGIPPEAQRRLFQEFYRVEPRGAGGAGLGLAISQQIAQLLEGRITVKSEVGRGSTFTLWLPVHGVARK